MQNVYKHAESDTKKKINRLKIFITTRIKYGANNLQFYSQEEKIIKKLICKIEEKTGAGAQKKT